MLIIFLIGSIMGLICEKKVYSNYMKKKIDGLKKFTDYFTIIHLWLSLKEKSIGVADYFEKSGYHSIAIYGMGILGKHLLEELKDERIKVFYSIDRNAKNIILDTKILTMEDELPEVDVIVVTTIDIFDEIHDSLREKINYPIISLEEVILNSLNELQHNGR